MEHASSPEQQERAPPEKMHATRNPPIYYSEISSPPGSQHSSNSAHPYCPVPSGFQYANLPVQSPHARYIEIQRAQMQGLASNPVSHLVSDFFLPPNLLIEEVYSFEILYLALVPIATPAHPHPNLG